MLSGEETSPQPGTVASLFLMSGQQRAPVTGARMEPFWMAARRMRRLLEDGEVTATEFALLMYVGVADGEREGVTMTLGHLAGLLDCSPRTARRALAKLRDLGLVSSDLRQGQRSPFRLLLGPS